jgi:hypothetical protein
MALDGRITCANRFPIKPSYATAVIWLPVLVVFECLQKVLKKNNIQHQKLHIYFEG